MGSSPGRVYTKTALFFFSMGALSDGYHHRNKKDIEMATEKFLKDGLVPMLQIDDLFL